MILSMISRIERKSDGREIIEKVVYIRNCLTVDVFICATFFGID